MSTTDTVTPPDPVEASEAGDYAWYCVRTKPKREHIAAKAMDQLEGVQSFCPRLRYRKATRRGKVWWVEAMFPGYVFAFFSRTENERNIVHTNGVMTILKFGDYVPEIPGSFIAELHEQMQAFSEGEDDTITLEPAVSVGDEVEIAHGAFQGFQAVCECTRRGGQFLIQTDDFSPVHGDPRSDFLIIFPADFGFPRHH